MSMYPNPQNAFLLDERSTATRLGVTPRTLQRWRVSGDGPAWVRIGPRLIRYAESEVDEYTKSRTYIHRAAELSGGDHE